MRTFKFTSEHAYYQDGWLVKRVWTQHNLTLTTTDRTILGWTAARLSGKLTCGGHPYSPEFLRILDHLYFVETP
jgi:hypothetical protein